MLLSIVGFLSKNWITDRIANSIKYKYEKDLKTHEAILKRDYDVVIERLKADLQIAAAERGIRFSGMYEATAKVIAELYSELVEMNDTISQLQGYLHPLVEDAQREEAFAEASKALHRFRSSFLHKRLYLPKGTSAKVHEFWSTVFDKYAIFHQEKTLRKKSPDDMKRLVDIHKEIPAILSLIQEDFQRLLGVTPNAIKSE